MCEINTCCLLYGFLGFFIIIIINPYCPQWGMGLLGLFLQACNWPVGNTGE